MYAKLLWLIFWAVSILTSCVVQGKRISNIQNVSAKRIANIKCEEYMNSTRTISRVISCALNPKPFEFPLSYNCSNTVNADRTAGGKNARPGEFPHQALLGWRTNETDVYKFNCAGTVISERYVLTAARCTLKLCNSMSEPVIVRFAELDLTKDEDEFDIEIESIIRHPAYRIRYYYHNIALVRLAEPLRFSALVQPACLWTDEDSYPSSVISSGFGLLDTTDEYGSDKLRKMQFNVLDLSNCNKQFMRVGKFPRGMTKNQLCIGKPVGVEDTCQSDLGGAIQTLTDPNRCIYHVLAVSSISTFCIYDLLGVYNKVASYLDWIEEIVWRPY